MFSFITLVQGMGLAYAAGLNLYAAVAITGLAVRYDWISNVPSTRLAVASPGAACAWISAGAVTCVG